MDVFDRLWLRENQQVVVAAQVAVKILETFAAERRFVELQSLDHGAHRAVEHEDAFAGKRAELIGGRRCLHGHKIRRLSAHRSGECRAGG